MEDLRGYTSIDEYISEFSPEIQIILENIRQTVREAAPGATEKISYGIPTFYLNGNLVHFAAYKNHIGFYPTGDGIEAFKQKIEAYKWSRGTVQFPLNKPIPYELISEITKYRVEQNEPKI